MLDRIDPKRDRGLLAKLAQTIMDPYELSRWRRDPDGFHAPDKSGRGGGGAVAEYDAEMFNDLLTQFDQQPEVQMRAIFSDLVRQAETAYRLSLTISRVMFALGIVITGTTFVLEVLYLLGVINMDWQSALAGGGVLGGLGIGSFVAIFVRGPQTQIQGALGNLAQIEIAFLSFISQSRGYDWTLVKNLDDSERLLRLISELRRETMTDIQKYLEDDGKGR